MNVDFYAGFAVAEGLGCSNHPGQGHQFAGMFFEYVLDCFLGHGIFPLAFNSVLRAGQNGCQNEHDDRRDFYYHDPANVFVKLRKKTGKNTFMENAMPFPAVKYRNVLFTVDGHIQAAQHRIDLIGKRDVVGAGIEQRDRICRIIITYDKRT